MSDIVTTHQLSKRYGDRQVVHDVDLRIPEGVVYGFLGPNGAGKSTTMKMLLSLIRPSSGSIRILGEPMTRENRHRLLGRIGSLIESPPGYGHLTGAENMRIVQHLLGLNDDDVRDAVRTVHLERHIDKKVRAYSLGMKQRLGIAMALVRRPRLLILDEPTNGLDPRGSRRYETFSSGSPSAGQPSWSPRTCSVRSTRRPPCWASWPRDDWSSRGTARRCSTSPRRTS